MIIDNFGISKLLELTSSGRMRNVARLHFVNGKSAKEIAIQMGYPESVIVSEMILIKSIVEKQLRAVYCDQCEKLFYTSNTKVRTCPLCKEKHKKETQEAEKAKAKSNRQKSTSTVKCKPKSLAKILKELRKYNNKNGTNLSYGQYVSIMGE
jgi:lipopolysaccharide biosynthesis regulator YciM